MRIPNAPTLSPPLAWARPLTRACALAVAVSLSLTSTAVAGELETHDGFFANASVGFGHTLMTSEPLRIEGDGSLMSLAAGYSVMESLSVYAQLSQTEIFAPSFRPNGRFDDDDHRISADISALGVGATFYGVPENLYAGLVLSLARASVRERMSDDGGSDTNFRSDLGFGCALTFGREWWIGDEWALGAAATVQASRILDQDRIAWHNGTFGLLFSATWN